MKLSEAIRAGAKLRPQSSDFYFEKQAGVVCSCALGSAIEASGICTAEQATNDPDFSYMEMADRLYARFPVLIEDVVEKLSLAHLIVGLNDSYGHTREEIADFLEEWGL